MINGADNKSAGRAGRLLHRLATLGILHEITGHARHRRFRYEPYVRLFDDD
jgi:hypothetical protein